MTQKRNDNHSTEFGLWLREQKKISSDKGFVATNIDYVWRNYKTGEWMMIEEKRYGKPCKDWQVEVFEIVDDLARNDPKYRGFHYIVFENTSPEDGKIMLDGKWITKEALLSFLRFEG